MSEAKSTMMWLGPDDPDPRVTPEVAGGKAWGVWRMASLGLAVPPAFALPTHLCAAANADGTAARRSVAEGLRAGIERMEAASGRRLGDRRAPLIVSVRSGAARSMPGMLASVLDVGATVSAAHGLIRLSGDPRFAWDCRRRFIESYAVVVGGAPAAAFAEALADMVRAERARDERDLDGEALERLAAAEAEIAARHASIPTDPLDQLTEAALAVFGSWNSPRAREYRRLNHLEDLAGTAVTVQAMVFGNRGPASGSGVAFSRDPSTGAAGLYVDFLADAQGEDVVSGRRTPADAAAFAARHPAAFGELARGAAKLERALGDVQDIEFTLEDGRLYFLQTRAAKRAPLALLRTTVDLVGEGVIDPAVALERLAGLDLSHLARSRFADAAEPVARGVPAAPGVASGRVALDSAAARTMAADGTPVILVRREPATDDITGFDAAAGVLTAVGGRTAHAAVVARQMGKVCVVGCASLRLDEAAGAAELAGAPLRPGDWLSLDGDRGEVTLGRREIVSEAPAAELAQVEAWRARARAQAARHGAI